MAVYFFYGEEDYNIEQEIKKFKENLDKNFLDMSFKTYDNPKFADLISILYTQPMMFGKMLIIINCFDYFNKTFDDKEFKEIEKAIENCSQNLDVIFLAKNSTVVKSCLNFLQNKTQKNFHSYRHIKPPNWNRS